MSEAPEKPVALQDLPELRRRTEGISNLLRQQLTHHLEILRPVLSPERVLGKHAGAKTDVPGADRALAELQQKYKEFSPKPFDLPIDMDAHWLTLVGNRLELHPWEYAHEIKTERESKTITMTSPFRWIVSYASNYSVAVAKLVLAGKEQRRPEYLRQFAVNALVLQLLLTKTPGLVQLFADLRYDLKTVVAPELPKLPLVCVTSGLPSFRPANDVILAATAFSGIPAFIELIDLAAVRDLQDPLKVKIEEMLK